MRISNRSKSKNIEDKRIKKYKKDPWTSTMNLEYVSPLTGKTTRKKYNRSAR
jgi:hypothetical protein